MRVALPILEDSSLIFARRVGDQLSHRGHDVFYVHVQEKHVKGSKLSRRQIEEALGSRGLDDSVTEAAFMTDDYLSSFGAVILGRSFRDMRARLGQEAFRKRTDRPRFIAFQAGIEFTPEKGAQNRLWFDAVFLNNPTDRDLFRAATQRGADQIVDWGHPYFLKPTAWRPLQPGAPIYFFAQAISPPTLGARLHPDRRIVLKLRHLPNENDKHVHKERFAYPWLQDRYGPPPPPNFAFETGPIGAALAQAGATITCTSTAAMDSISAGVPAFVYVDYVECYRDPLCAPMAAVFAGSGAISRLGDILRLHAPERPPAAWLDDNFREEGALYDALEAAMAGRPAFVRAA